MRTEIALLVAASLTGSSALAGCAAPAEEESTEQSEDQLLAGRRLPESEVATLLRNAGFPESVVPKMVCTAKWESSFYERASNKNRNGSVDRGLFQINSIHLGSAGCPSSASALENAATNTKCAYSVYKRQGANAWYGYKAHKSECDSYRLKSGAGASSSSGANDDGDDGDVGCYSATLHTRVGAGACVQSESNDLWYQCVDGQWLRGVSNGSGPSGPCKGQHPL